MGKKNKRKTQEEYIMEVEAINSNIQVIGEYINAKTAILHKCLIHNTEWMAQPTNILYGKGCPDCANEARATKNTLTHEAYVERLSVANPTIQVIGKYINAKTPILHKCLVHNIEYFTTPDNALRGNGCRKCTEETLEQVYDTRKKSEDEYIYELSVSNPTIKLIGKYISYNTPIEHYCETHKVAFYIRPGDALRGKSCKGCKADKISRARLIPAEDYIQELEDRNPNVKLVGKYINRTTPVEHKCLVHDVIWSPLPSHVLDGSGCPKCLVERIGNSNRKTNEQYVSELLVCNSNIIPMEEYVGHKIPIKHFCNKHQSFFDIAPQSALQGVGCPDCTTEKRHDAMVKSEEQYILELKEIHPNIILIGNYTTSHTPTLHKCLVDGYEWMPLPSSLLFGFGCPGCNKSQGEKAVELWLTQHNLEFIPQKRFDDCKDKQTLPFDFYLPSMNVCIEYQGRQHYEPIEHFGGEENLQYVQYHDEIKKAYCLDNGILLLCIPYWENVDNFLNENLLI